MDNRPWWDNFISIGKKITYTAWDETQANEIGTFFSYQEAVDAIKAYAKTLEPQEDKWK